MNIIPGAVWGLIPARGGPKSMPLKNLTPFVGRPLIDFQILAGKVRAVSGACCAALTTRPS